MLSTAECEEMLYIIRPEELDKLPGIMYHIIMRYQESPHVRALQTCLGALLEGIAMTTDDYEDHMSNDFVDCLPNVKPEEWKLLINTIYNLYSKYKTHTHDGYLQTQGEGLVKVMIKVKELYYSLIK